MQILPHDAFLALREGASILEADAHGDKVLLLPDGRMLKFFRRKRKISSAAWYPYAQRFADNCQGLAQRGIPCPQVLAVYRIPSIERDAVLYRPLAGETIRHLIANGMTESEAASLRKAIQELIAELHEKGVYFRSLHLGNIVRTPSGPLGLIDVADMTLQNRPLGYFARYRNRKHWQRYPAEAQWLADAPASGGR